MSSANLKSLSTIITSAHEGIPTNPNLVETSPSFISPWIVVELLAVKPARDLSSGFWRIGFSSIFA